MLFDVRLPRKAIVLCALLVACGGGDSSVPSDTLVSGVDTTSDTSAVQPIGALPRIPAPPGSLSPLADSISRRLVFVPTTQDIFTAAARGKRLVVDIGRVDIDVSRPPSRLTAYKEAVAARSPLRVGTRLRLRGRWGADDVGVSGFDVWNGRIVATITGAPRVDSLAQKLDPLIAVAQRADSTKPSIDTSCQRDTVDTLFDRRLDALRDSLLEDMKQRDHPRFSRLTGSLKDHSTRVMGCFASGRALLQTALVGGDYEWVRERVLLVDAGGSAKPIAVQDFRFRAHELLEALDVDEDGFDDVGGRAFTERAGGTVVLRVLEGKRLERLTSGFAWER